MIAYNKIISLPLAKTSGGGGYIIEEERGGMI